MTPLMLACGEGYAKIAELLILEDAEIDAVDVRSYTILRPTLIYQFL